MGVFLKDGFLVNLEYDRIETEISGTSLIRRTFTSNVYAVLAKYVRESRNGTALNIEHSIALRQFDDPNNNGSNIIVGLLGDYYVNKRVSFGGRIEFDKGDNKDNEGKTAAININAFITPIFSIDVEFEKFFADNPEGEDERSFDVLLTARF